MASTLRYYNERIHNKYSPKRKDPADVFLNRGLFRLAIGDAWVADQQKADPQKDEAVAPTAESQKTKTLLTQNKSDEVLLSNWLAIAKRANPAYERSSTYAFVQSLKDGFLPTRIALEQFDNPQYLHTLSVKALAPLIPLIAVRVPDVAIQLIANLPASMDPRQVESIIRCTLGRSKEANPSNNTGYVKQLAEAQEARTKYAFWRRLGRTVLTLIPFVGNSLADRIFPDPARIQKPKTWVQFVKSIPVVGWLIAATGWLDKKENQRVAVNRLDSEVTNVLRKQASNPPLSDEKREEVVVEAKKAEFAEAAVKPSNDLLLAIRTAASERIARKAATARDEIVKDLATDWLTDITKSAGERIETQVNQMGFEEQLKQAIGNHEKNYADWQAQIPHVNNPAFQKLISDEYDSFPGTLPEYQVMAAKAGVKLNPGDEKQFVQHIENEPVAPNVSSLWRDYIKGRDVKAIEQKRELRNKESQESQINQSLVNLGIELPEKVVSTVGSSGSRRLADVTEMHNEAGQKRESDEEATQKNIALTQDQPNYLSAANLKALQKELEMLENSGDNVRSQSSSSVMSGGVDAILNQLHSRAATATQSSNNNVNDVLNALHNRSESSKELVASSQDLSARDVLRLLNHNSPSAVCSSEQPVDVRDVLKQLKDKSHSSTRSSEQINVNEVLEQLKSSNNQSLASSSQQPMDAEAIMGELKNNTSPSQNEGSELQWNVNDVLQQVNVNTSQRVASPSQDNVDDVIGQLNKGDRSLNRSNPSLGLVDLSKIFSALPNAATPNQSVDAQHNHSAPNLSQIIQQFGEGMISPIKDNSSTANTSSANVNVDELLAQYRSPTKSTASTRSENAENNPMIVNGSPNKNKSISAADLSGLLKNVGMFSPGSHHSSKGSPSHSPDRRRNRGMLTQATESPPRHATLR